MRTLLNKNQFSIQVVFATLLAAACAAPQTLLKTVNEGPQTGPLTPLVGNLVQTPKGLRPIDLEGFSEDLDQDGFVDPIAPAAPAPVVAPLPAPVVRTVPVQAPIVQAAPVAVPAPVVRTPVVQAPFVQAPIVRTFAPQPVAAPVVRQFVPQVVPQVRTVVASPIKTIAPLPVPVRAAPSAQVFDVRRFI